MPSLPKTEYAKSGDVHIAYQVTGAGPLDLVFVPGYVSHLEYQWEHPWSARFFEERGTHTLKGVPGEWRLNAVAHTG